MLFSEYKLKGVTAKNRIVFPPVVCMNWTDNNYVTQKNIDHYTSVARGGAGLIITEAVSIEPSARLHPTQIGAWDDSFIEGLSKIALAVHNEGVPIIAQIHHGGIQSYPGPKKVPSDIVAKIYGKDTQGYALTIDEIKKIEQQFVDTAIRCQKAGMDGVELHGAHTYLLSYFLSDRTNKRTDEYGGSVENRARLPLDIIKRIRKECGEDFIIGIRYGGAMTSLEDGIAAGKMFEAAGCDYLHVSYGASPSERVEVPQEYSEWNSMVYTAIEIKKQVSIPVIAVNDIDTAERAHKLVDNGMVDFVALARPILADYEWPNKIKAGTEPVKCFKCKPSCRWFMGALVNCPARKAAQKAAESKNA